MSSTPLSIRLDPETLAQVDEVARRTGRPRASVVTDLVRAALAPLPEPELPPADVILKRLTRIDETIGRLMFHLAATTPEPLDPKGAEELAEARMRRLVERMGQASIWKRFGA